MNFKTVAEGIETMDQLLFLKENHCEYGQGYYFSKPILPAELIELIDIKEKP
ncbi:MAG: EAL domain-containing protein [Alkalibacterium gilvum]|uniref:EAL domain-containing protein n=2 Tax=Alkalibacterium gilvum TaxID=1130080 RepID=UPI003F8E6A8D